MSKNSWAQTNNEDLDQMLLLKSTKPVSVRFFKSQPVSPPYKVVKAMRPEKQANLVSSLKVCGCKTKSNAVTKTNTVDERLTSLKDNRLHVTE